MIPRTFPVNELSEDLFPDQLDAIWSTHAHIAEGAKRILGVACTGWGKTRWVTNLAKGLGARTLFLAHRRELIDQAAAVAGAHRDDAGHIALHHHVAAVGIHPQPPQLGLQLLQVAGHAVGAVAAAVGAAGGHPQFAGHAPFRLARLNPRPLLRGLQPCFRFIGLPVAQVKANGDHRFGGLAVAQHGAVH